MLQDKVRYWVRKMKYRLLEVRTCNAPGEATKQASNSTARANCIGVAIRSLTLRGAIVEEGVDASKDEGERMQVKREIASAN